jgi:hypothetical protein
MTKPDDLVNSVYRGDGDGMYPGLTKRELFAAMAMQGLIIKEDNTDTIAMVQAISLDAVSFADILIKALNNELD